MIGVIYMCLSVILLVNNFYYWLAGMEKCNVRCKTFLYCTREITLSWKFLFCMLKINYLVIKLFLELHLNRICAYICVSWICTYMIASIYFYVFLVNFGIENDYIGMFISYTKVKQGILNIFTITSHVRLLHRIELILPLLVSNLILVYNLIVASCRYV